MRVDSNDASEKLNSLKWSTAFVVNSEKLHESAAVVSNSPESEGRFYGVYLMNIVLTAHKNIVGNRTLPESDMCYNSLVSNLAIIELRIFFYLVFILS